MNIQKLSLAIFASLFLFYGCLNQNNTNSPTQQADRITESPEYSTKPIEGDWYNEIPELRGQTEDQKYMYRVKIHLMYTAGDKELEAEIINRSVQIQDQLLTWFSRQEAQYLQNIENREVIRELIKQDINKILNKPIMDIKFSQFEILKL